MSVREELELSWKAVETAKVPAEDKIRLLETAVSTVIGKVLVGLDARGRRHLCLPTTAAEVGLKDRLSRGVVIETLELEAASGPRPFVDVLCRDAKLNPIFSIVAADMLEAVRTSPAQPFSTCHSVLERWRMLLEKERPALMSLEELSGLFAELLVLEALGAINPRVLSSWRGPDRDMHDFVCGPVDIEVKSTRSAASDIIEISDLHQLESAPGVNLYVAFHRVHLAPGRGRSVPSVIDDLVELGLDEPELFAKLGLYGYDPRDAEKYLDLPFELLEERWYPVDSKFPRLVPGSFITGKPPAEVKKVRYSLDLSGVKDRLDGAARDAVITRAAGGAK